ncbi:MAG: FtsX-like permease family protein, partial [Terriglobales bacterium]
YSALSYAVAQRTHEMGVRMALGAEPSRLLTTMLAQGMRPAWIGAAVGLGLVLACGRFAAAFLPGISAHDPLSLALAALILLAVAALACWIPARRAARVDPLIALREP